MRDVGMCICCLCVALSGCRNPPPPPYVLLIPRTTDKGIEVSLFAGNGDNTVGQLNQTSPPTPPVVGRIENALLLTVVASAMDPVGGITEVEIDFEKRSCNADGNGGAYSAGGGSGGLPPLSRYGATAPGSAMRGSGTGWTTWAPIFATTSAIVNVSRDLGLGIYEVDYQFIASTRNRNLSMYSAPIQLAATTDNKPITHGCFGPPFHPPHGRTGPP